MRGISRASLAESRERLEAHVADADAESLHRLAGDLFGVVHLLDAEPRLRRVVTDPASDPDRRAGLIGGLVRDRVSSEAAEVVDGLVRASWSAPRDVVDALDDLAAQTVFAAAERADSLDDVEDELFRFSRILGREPGLRTALTDPALPVERKESVIGDLLGAKVHRSTLTLVSEVVLHPRGRTIDRGLEEYSRLAAARRERLVARVRAVVPLTEAQMRRLEDVLAARLGHRVHVNVEIDPEILGGVSVRVGDQLFDGTVVHHLTEARRLMTR